MVSTQTALTCPSNDALLPQSLLFNIITAKIKEAFKLTTLHANLGHYNDDLGMIKTEGACYRITNNYPDSSHLDLVLPPSTHNPPQYQDDRPGSHRATKRQRLNSLSNPPPSTPAVQNILGIQKKPAPPTVNPLQCAVCKRVFKYKVPLTKHRNFCKRSIYEKPLITVCQEQTNEEESTAFAADQPVLEPPDVPTPAATLSGASASASHTTTAVTTPELNEPKSKYVRKCDLSEEGQSDHLSNATSVNDNSKCLDPSGVDTSRHLLHPSTIPIQSVHHSVDTLIDIKIEKAECLQPSDYYEPESTHPTSKNISINSVIKNIKLLSNTPKRKTRTKYASKLRTTTDRNPRLYKRDPKKEVLPPALRRSKDKVKRSTARILQKMRKSKKQQKQKRTLPPVSKPDQTKELNHPCKQCLCRFEFGWLLRRHEYTVHGIGVPLTSGDVSLRQNGTECKVCAVTPTHAVFKEMCTQIPSTTKQGNLCGICGLKFDNNTKLDLHLISHDNLLGAPLPQSDDRFMCYVCYEKYDTYRGLLGHHSHQHTTRHACKVCNKTFEQIATLRRHECVRVPITCKHCSLTFMNVAEHEKHTESHSSTGTRPTVCKLCDCSFSTVLKYKVHRSVQHPTPDQRCQLCFQAQCTEAALIQHLTSVHNTLLFLCTICEAAFSEPHKLSEHMLIQHKK